jgi:predicted dehydrogenase
VAFKIGICALNFGARFASFFAAHPWCEEVVLCDIRQQRIKEVAEECNIRVRTCNSFDELIKTDVEQEFPHDFSG